MAMKGEMMIVEGIVPAVRECVAGEDWECVLVSNIDIQSVSRLIIGKV